MQQGEDLSKVVEKWLRTQGYPLEMKVAGALRERRFIVEQGCYYSDPETRTSREIDVIASSYDEYGLLSVSFVVECKSSRDRPWVLFGCEESGNRLFNFALSSTAARMHLTERLFCDPEAESQVQSLTWFIKPNGNGYGLVTAMSNSGEDAAFKAVMSVLKASIDVLRVGADREGASLQFVLPVIVLEGRLFEARLGDEGVPTVTEIQSGFLSTGRLIDGVACPSVHVVTSQALEEFCDKAADLRQELVALLKADCDLLWQRLTGGSGEADGER